MIDGRLQPYHPGETDTYWNEKECYCIPYIWQFSYNEEYYYGRNFRDFRQVLEKLRKDTHYIIWVHNLSYEFAFLSDFMGEWEMVFARQAHKPMKAIPKDFPNVEFRCSYFLTRLSLDSWGKELGLHKLHTLDYTVLRTPKTEMDDKELDYAERDCAVVYKGIKKYKEKYGHVERIPLTQTGEVRRELKHRLQQNKTYMNRMQRLLPKDVTMYHLLKQAFAGGYTHANMINADYVHTEEEMGHPGYAFDFASSYPYVMCSEKFPMTPFVEDNFNENDFDVKAYLIHVSINDISSITYNHYISLSKCFNTSNVKCDNGRVISADHLEMWITEQDYDIIVNTYRMACCEIVQCFSSRKAYLEKDFIDYILELYGNKTSYKNVPGKEDIYAQSKQYINSLFGMCVTDLIQDEVELNGTEWSVKERTVVDVQKALDDLRYNNKGRTFLCYAHGVWITAYARHNLWELIQQADEDVIYCDTDSLKLREWHDWTDYNNKVNEKLKAMCDTYNIDFNRTRPKDPKGIERPLGIFAREDDWTEFRTLGAKRYCYRDAEDGKLHLTVSGINKEAVICLNDDIYNFNEDTCFDKDAIRPKRDKNGEIERDEEGGIIYEGVKKKYSCYTHNMKPVVWNLGEEDEYESDWHCGIVMRPTGYDMSMASDYLCLLESIHVKLRCMERA